MKKILIVDDDKVSLMTAKTVLSDVYKVIAVTEGSQAVKYLSKNSCDLILLDINMPEMDGFATFKAIREMEDCADIPIVFLTSDSDAETETKCFETGAIDFISKPFVPSVIKSRVGRVIELEELRKSLADKLRLKTLEVTDILRKSQKDSLTELGNREYSESIIDSYVKNGGSGAFLMIDMDNFKLINDIYGHNEGDVVLKALAGILKNNSGDDDFLGRIGGDEFVLFLPDKLDKDELTGICDSILKDITAFIGSSGYNTNSSVSIGIAFAPEDGEDFRDLYTNADKALYYVKQNGKNSFHFYGDQLTNNRNRSDLNINLKYLGEMLGRSDSGNGAYQLDFDNFQHVYNFLKRFVDRNEKEIQTILFSAVKNAPAVTLQDTEKALEVLDSAIFTSLRRGDISTRYSSRQTIVIIVNSDYENGIRVAERIKTNFEEIYKDGLIRLDYDIAAVESKMGNKEFRADET